MDWRRDDVGWPALLILDGPGGVGEQQLLGDGAKTVSWLAALYFSMSSENNLITLQPVTCHLLTCSIVGQSDYSSEVFAY